MLVFFMGLISIMESIKLRPKHDTITQRSDPTKFSNDPFNSCRTSKFHIVWDSITHSNSKTNVWSKIQYSIHWTIDCICIKIYSFDFSIWLDHLVSSKHVLFNWRLNKLRIIHSKWFKDIVNIIIFGRI